jgi:hypothetical protein
VARRSGAQVQGGYVDTIMNMCAIKGIMLYFCAKQGYNESINYNILHYLSW